MQSLSWVSLNQMILVNCSIDSWMDLCLIQSSLVTRQKQCHTSDTNFPANINPARIEAPHCRHLSTVFCSFTSPPASCNPTKMSGFFLLFSKLESCEMSGCLDQQLSHISIYRGISHALRNKQTCHDTIVRIKDPMSLNTQNSTRQACQCMG